MERHGEPSWKAALALFTALSTSSYSVQKQRSLIEISTVFCLSYLRKVLLSPVNAVYHLYELRSVERCMLSVNGLCNTHRVSLFHFAQKPPCCRIMHRNLSAAAGLVPLVIDEQLRRQIRKRNKLQAKKG